MGASSFDSLEALILHFGDTNLPNKSTPLTKPHRYYVRWASAIPALPRPRPPSCDHCIYNCTTRGGAEAYVTSVSPPLHKDTLLPKVDTSKFW